MAVTVAELTANGTGTDATSFTTASVSPATDALVLLFVSARRSPVPDPTISGCGLTWESVASVVNGARRFMCYRAMGTPTPGAVTMDYGGANTIAASSWTVLECAGVDTGGTNGSGAVVQAVTATASGTSLAVTLSAFGDATNNAVVGAWQVQSDSATSPIDVEAGYTEGTQPTMTESTCHRVGWKVGEDTSVSASWPLSQVSSAIALEIKAATAGTTASPGVGVATWAGLAPDVTASGGASTGYYYQRHGPGA